jgi:uncharacterized membrane protein
VRADPGGRLIVAPRWAWPIALLLTLVGLGLATYLTIAHFNTHIVLACSSKGLINCEKVTTSAQSHVFGIPVAVLGLAYFVGMVPWQLPAAWRSADPRIRFGRLLYCASGIVFVIYLVYAELVLIQNICLWCTGVHVVTFLIFIVTAFATALSFSTDASYLEPDPESQLDDGLPA